MSEDGAMAAVMGQYGRRVGMARAVVAAVALLVLAIMLARWGLLLWSSLHNEAGRYDFSSYYAAAAALRADPHANIYDDTLIGRVGIQAHTLVAPPLPYTYPPLFAILLSPFTLISFRVLSRLWLVGNFALWLGITVLLAREMAVILGPRLRAALGNSATSTAKGAWARGWLADPTPLVALALAALLSQPFTPAGQTLSLGQINFLVLLPLALIPELTRRGQERWVGAMVAIAAMLKFTPAILLLYLALRRRWQAFFAALATLAGLALVSMAVVGPSVFVGAFTQALHVSGADAALGHNEALLASFLPTDSPLKVAQYLILALLLLLLGLLLWRGPRVSSLSDQPAARAESETIGYAIALCAVLLLPTAWVHHYVWLLPTAAIALALAGATALNARTGGEWARAVALALLVLVGCWALGFNLPYAWDTEPNPAITVYLGLPRAFWLELRPLGMVLLLLALAYWYRSPATLLAPRPARAHDILGAESRP